MSGIEVGLGFYKEWNDLLPQVIPAVQQLHSQYPTFQITVTGHSLGAAISILCALELAEQGYENIMVYNYGLPRVGNEAFSDYYRTLVCDNCPIHIQTICLCFCQLKIDPKYLQNCEWT